MTVILGWLMISLSLPLAYKYSKMRRDLRENYPPNHSIRELALLGFFTFNYIVLILLIVMVVVNLHNWLMIIPALFTGFNLLITLDIYTIKKRLKSMENSFAGKTRFSLYSLGSLVETI